MTKRRSLILAAALVLGAAAPSIGHADAYLRVIAQQAPVYTGPGTEYRAIYLAERGEVFPVVERGTSGYWFRVEMEDGTTGWVFGELVFPFEVVDGGERGFWSRTWRGIRRAVFGPSPVAYADVQISFSAGALDGEGTFVLRPQWIIDKYWAVELFGGLNPRAQEDLYLAGAGWTLRLAPGTTFGPNVHAGLGAAYFRPKRADNPVSEPRTLMAVEVGGGFELTFKKQITLRLDFRNWTLFDPDSADNAQEYSGGLAIFF